ncbi:MAG: pyridoxal 5'-phosphate synthase lyase subunit PdxS [archaeon]
MTDTRKTGTDTLKRGFAKMVKSGVVMDVTNATEAKLAEDAGAVAVMALERVPSDIRAHGGVARMSAPEKIEEIIKSVTIPVMAKARIGHFKEAEILEALGADMVDESEVLTPADDEHHIDKSKFKIPFVCGCRNLGEALRRINEGAAMIRTKGEAGTGNVVEAVRHTRKLNSEIAYLVGIKQDETELRKKANEYGVPFELVKEVAGLGRLPVVNFAAGGIATVADAAMMMDLGVDGIFVGSGIFKSQNPKKLAKAMVEAVKNYDKPEILAQISKNLGEPMKGIEISTLKPEERLQER